MAARRLKSAYGEPGYLTGALVPGSYAAVPSTLRKHGPLKREKLTCGAKGARTPDPLLAKQVLFQLSYSPEMSPA